MSIPPHAHVSPRYGRLDVDDEAIEDAARKANAHDFIMQLPEVGNQGCRALSIIMLCVVYFSGPQGSWIVCCSHLKIEYSSCTRGHEWCGIFHYH